MKELIEQLLCDADVFQNMKQGGFACYLVAKRYNDAADALEKMEAENAQLRRERDAAVADLERVRSCTVCKYCDSLRLPIPEVCQRCTHASNWEWRGVQEG